MYEDEQHQTAPEVSATPEPQAELAKLQLEVAKIQAQTNAGWQEVVTKLADMWQKHSAGKSTSERRYTTTLTIGILVFLATIVGALSVLTLRGIVSGESLVFFLGTLTGSVLMLVSERIKTREE